MSEVTVKLLGGFEVRVGSGPALSFPTRKAKALLAYLAVCPGKSHSRSDLANLLWGDRGDEQARASLRQALTYLRNALTPAGDEVLVVQGDLVSVDAAVIQVDVCMLESLVAQGTPEALERAAALYRGEFLEGFDLREPEFNDWLRDERAHLRKVVTEALKELLKYHMENDHSTEGLQTADQLLAIDPLQEDVHRAVMRLHLREGERIPALKQYETCREVLQRELGIDPDDETNQLWNDARTGQPHQVEENGRAASNRLPCGPKSAPDRSIHAARHRLVSRGWQRSSLILAIGVTVIVVVASVAWIAQRPTPAPERAAVTHEVASETRQPFAMRNRPSLAVLPFDNFSGDPALDYFADGLSEDIITTLSRFPDLAVISRNSSFVYKGKATDIRQIGKELGATYVLEGSVRKQGDTIRLSAQLIEAASGEHVWAERYDEEGADPWALQDEVITKIVDSLTGERGQLIQAEYKRTWGKDSGSLEEYDYYLRGHELFKKAETEDVLEQAGAAWSEGLRKFPNSSLLRAKLALYHLMFVWRYWSDDPAARIRQAERLLQEARSLPGLTPQARRIGHWAMAWTQQMKGDLPRALAEAKAAIALSPYDAFMVGDLAGILAMAGEPADAIALLEEIRSRSRKFEDHWALTVAYYLVGDDERAIETALEYRPSSLDRYVLLASSYARLGQMDEARAAIEKLLELDPQFTQEDVKENYLYSDPSILERQVADLGKAGLPEK
jgi:TolB-like protein/DNA-binding SARP family transcriptional activator